jgi:hypothetical protein
MTEIEVVVARMLVRLVDAAAAALRPIAEGAPTTQDHGAAERLVAALRHVLEKPPTGSGATAKAALSTRAKIANAKANAPRRRGRKPMQIEHEGRRKTAEQWAALFGTGKAVIHSRRRRGVPIDGSVSRRRRPPPNAANAPAAPAPKPAATASAGGSNGSASEPAKAAKPEPDAAPAEKTRLDPTPASRALLALNASSIIEARGKRQTIVEWSRECDVPIGAVLGRLRQGRPVEIALEPVRR